jgi:transposase
VRQNLTSIRILEILRQKNYQGAYSILKDFVRHIRPQIKEPVVRDEPKPGRWAQIDWSVQTVALLGLPTKLHFFHFVLSHSRALYVECFRDEKLMNFLNGHVRAFHYVGGVPAKLLFDNLRSVVGSRVGRKIIFNERFLAFARHYDARPRAHVPRKPRQKGRVERSVHFLEESFLAGRTFESIDDVNRQLREWLDQRANTRKHGTTGRIPFEVLKEEQPFLKPLPLVAFDTAEITTRICPVDGILSIFGNRYSMPSHLVGQVVTVRIAETQIQVFHDQKLVAAHQRVLDVHGQTLIDPKHYDDLRAARAKGSGGDTAATPLEAEFLSLGPESDKFLEGLQKKYASGALGHVAKILQLKRDYASEHIHQAIAKALSFEAFDWRRVAGILAAEFSRTLPPGQPALDPGTVAQVKQWIQEFRVTNRDLSEYQKHVFSEEENDESPKPTHDDGSTGSEPPRGLDPGNAGAAQTPDDRPRV